MPVFFQCIHPLLGGALGMSYLMFGAEGNICAAFEQSLPFKVASHIKELKHGTV